MSGRTKHYTVEEKRTVLRLLDEGTTIAELVRHTGVSRPTVYRWIREHEVDLEAVAKAGPERRTFDRAAIRRMFEDGATGREVAQTFGCSLRYAYAVKNGELE